MSPYAALCTTSKTEESRHSHDARLRREGYGHGERGDGSVWSGRTSVSTVHAKKTALIEERAVETTLGGSAVRPRLCTVCDRVIRCACRSSTCAHACSAILNKPPSVHPTRSTLFERRANATVLFSIGQSIASLLHSAPSQRCNAVKLALKTTAGRHLRTFGPRQKHCVLRLRTSARKENSADGGVS